jgi:hypothetical protein
LGQRATCLSRFCPVRSGAICMQPCLFFLGRRTHGTAGDHGRVVDRSWKVPIQCRPATHAYIPLHMRWPSPAGWPSDHFIRDDDSETHSTHCHTRAYSYHTTSSFLPMPASIGLFFISICSYISCHFVSSSQADVHASRPFANMLVTCNIKTSTGQERTQALRHMWTGLLF